MEAIRRDAMDKAVAPATTSEALDAFEASVEHHFAVNNGVKIHTAATGAGPLVVFIHGFPDHWLGWWRQMSDLRDSYRVVAVDLRGYNLSDKPEAPEAYEVRHLIADLRAVITQEGAERATVIGQDWGGFIAWHTAMAAPELVERVAILNMPHPWAMARDLAHHEPQQKASEYVRLFKQPLAYTQVPLARMGMWVKDAAFKLRHDAAMAASSLQGMLSYYRMNWPAEPYQELTHEPPHIKSPTLIIHGLADQYVMPVALNDVWKWVDSELTMVAIPDVGHFVHHDSPHRVTRAIRNWLAD
jgi:epoxide hydrolase 4